MHVDEYVGEFISIAVQYVGEYVGEFLSMLIVQFHIVS